MKLYHVKYKTWLTDVYDYTFDKCETKAEAQEREKVLIRQPNTYIKKTWIEEIHPHTTDKGLEFLNGMLFLALLAGIACLIILFIGG